MGEISYNMTRTLAGDEEFYLQADGRNQKDRDANLASMFYQKEKETLLMCEMDEEEILEAMGTEEEWRAQGAAIMTSLGESMAMYTRNAWNHRIHRVKD